MENVYTLSQIDGLVPTPEFKELEKALVFASTRADTFSTPITVFENGKPLYACHTDGSISEANEGLVTASLEDETSGLIGIVAAEYSDTEVTLVHLTKDLPETRLKQLEKEIQADIGLYDSDCLVVYTQDSSKLFKLEQLLSKLEVPVLRIKYTTVRSKPPDSNQVVAGFYTRSGLVKVPKVEFNYGKGSRVKQFSAYAEDYQDAKTGKYKYLVKVNGRVVGTTSSAKSAKRLIENEAQAAFSKYLQKVLY